MRGQDAGAKGMGDPSVRLARWLLGSVGFLLTVVALLIGGDNQSLIAGLGLLGGGAVILAAVFPHVKTVRLAGIEAELQQAENRIAQLFVMAMSPEAYSHLKRLDDPGPIRGYRLDPWVREELKHLQNLGFIEVVPENGKKRGIHDIEDEPDDLRSEILITDLGTEYVRLREREERRLR
jgi:hypothetical protein